MPHPGSRASSILPSSVISSIASRAHSNWKQTKWADLKLTESWKKSHPSNPKPVKKHKTQPWTNCKNCSTPNLPKSSKI
jgi:hypothetical protein